MGNQTKYETDIPRTRQDYFYLLVATRYYLNYRNEIEILGTINPTAQYESMLKELNAKGVSSMTEMDFENMVGKYGLSEFTSGFFRIQVCVHVAIVFAAMCLESLINDYAVIRKSADFFNKEIKDLPTFKKWELAPELICGKAIDTQTLEAVRELFQLRNKLVHPKSTAFQHEEWKNKTIKLWLRQVNTSFHAITLGAKGLYQIDPAFYYLEEYKWLWDKHHKCPSSLVDFFNLHWGFKK